MDIVLTHNASLNALSSARQVWTVTFALDSTISLVFSTSALAMVRGGNFKPAIHYIYCARLLALGRSESLTAVLTATRFVSNRPRLTDNPY